MVALAIEDMALELGYTVVGLVSRMDTAFDLARKLDVDLAILDVCVDGKKTFPIADILQRREIPILFSTGYGRTAFPKEYLQSRILNKPYNQDALQHALAQLFMT